MKSILKFISIACCDNAMIRNASWSSSPKGRLDRQDYYFVSLLAILTIRTMVENAEVSASEQGRHKNSHGGRDHGPSGHTHGVQFHPQSRLDVSVVDGAAVERLDRTEGVDQGKDIAGVVGV